MMEYWLDANTYIESSNRFYRFDMAPTFWKVLEEQASKGVICSPSKVYAEVERHANSDLLRWIKAQKSTKLFYRAATDKYLQV